MRARFYKRKRRKWKLGLAWPSGKERRCWVSYPTLPGLPGPILYSSIILQTILCLVLFLLFLLLFCSPFTCLLDWIFLFFFLSMYSTWSFVAFGFRRRLNGPGVFCLSVLQLAFSSCTQIWGASSFTLSFFLFESSNWNTVSTHFSLLGQSPTVVPPPALIHHRSDWFRHFSADFTHPPLRGQVHCVDYWCNSCE